MALSRKQILLKFGGETAKTIISVITSKTPAGGILKVSFGNTMIDSLQDWLNNPSYLTIEEILRKGIQNREHIIRSNFDIVCAAVEDCLSLNNDEGYSNAIADGAFNIDLAVEKWSAPILAKGAHYDYEQDIKVSLRYVIRSIVEQTVNDHLVDVLLASMRQIDGLMKEQEKLLIFKQNLENNLQDLFNRVGAVEDELHRITYRSSFHFIISKLRPFSNKGANRYHFSNKKMEDYIIGRNKELKMLERFINQKDNFAYCVITGPGGIGKNKLVYSFMLKQAKKEKQHPELSHWNMRFANISTLYELQMCEIWDIEQDTLLVYDYAGETPEQLQRCINRIIDFETTFKHKLRLILLNQVGKSSKSNQKDTNPYDESFGENPRWYQAIIAPPDRAYYVSESRVKNYEAFFISLDRLKKRDYLSLIKNYAKRVGGVSLSQHQIDEVLRFSEKFTRSDSRPLFIMAAVDAVLQQENGRIDGWTINDILSFIINRDKHQWERDIVDDNVRKNLMDALTYATIFGEWNLNSDLVVDNQSVAIVICNALIGKNQGKVRDWLRAHSISPDEEVWPVSAYEPDAIGEYYALYQIASYPPIQKQWAQIVYSNLEHSEAFFHRCVLNSRITGTTEKLRIFLLRLVEQVDANSIEKAKLLMHFAMSAFVYGDAKELAIELTDILLQRCAPIEDELISFTKNTFAHFEFWTHSYRKKRLDLIVYLKTKIQSDSTAYKIWIRMIGLISYSEYCMGHHKLGSTYCDELFEERLKLSDARIDEIMEWLKAMKDSIRGQYYTGQSVNDALNMLDNYANNASDSEIIEYYIDCYSLFFKHIKTHSPEEISKHINSFNEIIKKIAPKDGWQACYKTISLVLSADIASLLRCINEFNGQDQDYVQCFRSEVADCIESYKRKYQEYMEKWSTDFIVQNQFERGIQRIVSADNNAYTYFKDFM